MAPKGTIKGSNGTGGGGRIKFRFVDIEMDNVNESVTEGLKSLAAALSRGGTHQTAAVRTLPRAAQQTVRPDLPADLVAEIEEDGQIRDIEGEQVGEDEPDEPAAPAAPSGAKERKFRAPQFLHEINLTTASTPLKEYLDHKDPSSIQDKYLAIAQWFKEFMTIDEVKVDHIFTAYDTIGWRAQVPQDASAPLRWLKHANLMESGSARGTYKVTWKGTKSVAEMGAPQGS